MDAGDHLYDRAALFTVSTVCRSGGTTIGLHAAEEWNSYACLERRENATVLELLSLFLIYTGCPRRNGKKLRESVPYVKIYRYNPKHLCPKLNGYGDKGQRKVWSFCGSTYYTWFAWRNIHTLRIVCPCLQLAQARSSLRLHM